MDDLIRREDTIEVIHSAIFDFFDIVEDDSESPITYKDEKLLEMNKAITKRIRELPSAPRWIPCSEKLPDEDNLTGGGKQFSADVLMTVVNTIDDEIIIDYGHTTDGEWYSDTTDCYIPNGWKVLAWMPLPEAWKGEEDE